VEVRLEHLEKVFEAYKDGESHKHFMYQELEGSLTHANTLKMPGEESGGFGLK
jgi:hypothetical protein